MGLMPHDCKPGEFVPIFGYHTGRTEEITEKIIENGRGHQILICASPDQATENPFDDDDIKFARGNIATKDFLKFVRIKDADTILVDAHRSPSATTDPVRKTEPRRDRRAAVGPVRGSSCRTSPGVKMRR